MASSLLRALLHARSDVPDSLARFDGLARAGSLAPSFEEYSARIGESLSPWRETCYFDLEQPGDATRAPAQRAVVAHEQLIRCADELGFSLPGSFLDALRAGATSGSDVLQIVLGFDAGADGAAARLKYYLIFRDDSHATVERLRTALGVAALPASLRPGSVYILGIDFAAEALHDFKIYVRLDPRRVPAVIRNLDEFGALWRGSRYLVFQQCLLSAGRQVYFHASSAEVLDAQLRSRAAEPAAAALLEQVGAMNESLAGQGTRLRPWIASFTYDSGKLRRTPSNVYFHFESSTVRG